jgi:hypothetical protein
VRDWLAPSSWRWVDVQFGEHGPNIVMWKADLPVGEIFDGAIYRDGAMYRITGYEEDVQTLSDDLKPIPRAFQARLRDSGGHILELRGQVEKVFPVIFGSRDGARMSWNDRAMVSCEWQGRSGHGNIEFAETLVVRSP